MNIPNLTLCILFPLLFSLFNSTYIDTNNRNFKIFDDFDFSEDLIDPMNNRHEITTIDPVIETRKSLFRLFIKLGSRAAIPAVINAARFSRIPSRYSIHASKRRSSGTCTFSSMFLILILQPYHVWSG
ncbi:hypothetical protein SNEBB_009888 [Seison nebaliae]|nr:hypothetical protein SNEBB_009888 [Seison nebaliae]